MVSSHCVFLMDVWSRVLLLLLLMSLQLHHTGGSPVQVKPEVSAHVGDDVTLPCRYSSTSGEPPSITQAPPSIIQVQWYAVNETQKENIIIVFSSSFGMNVANSSLIGRLQFSNISPGDKQLAQDQKDGSIHISKVQQADQAQYICEFITFPAGSFRAITNLTITDETDESSESSGHLSPGHTAAVAMGIILAVLLLVTVLLFFIRARRNNTFPGTAANGNRNRLWTVTPKPDLTYADVQFKRPPITNPDSTLNYMTVTPSGQLGSSAPPSRRGSGSDWPESSEVETVYSAVRV